MTTNDQIDDHGHAVIEFISALRNASRLGVYADTIVGMFQSGDWRDYKTAAGHDQWRECEFDYFLIAQDARHEDVQRILNWANVKAVDVGQAMNHDADPSKRRTLEEADADWATGHTLGTTLIRRAEANGWVNTRTGRMIRPPVSKRVVAKVRHGETWDTMAERSRAERITAGRRRHLDQLAKRISDEMETDDERRYLIDKLRSRDTGRPPAEAKHRADAERLKWDTAALAKHWKLSRDRAQERVERLREVAGSGRGTNRGR
jgi:hypothetical protein